MRADNNPGYPDSYEPNGADACAQDALAIESLVEVATPRVTMIIPAPRLPLASEASSSDSSARGSSSVRSNAIDQ
ncbi:hypothetical protein [Paraburkholderia sp. MM6662-R1]|uniref:hypothetical protein n=1 Tax=Paraburkholderia sp. MM6662-R1 TaxID=2991066 RepID=UPI003D230DD7